jgi:hypothetical protein
MVVFEKWIEFKEFIELEREDTTRDSQGGFQHTTSMVENSNIKRIAKRGHKRRKHKQRKMKKYWGKL